MSCDTVCTAWSKTCDETDFRDNIDNVASQTLMTNVLSTLGFTCTTFNENFGTGFSVPLVRLDDADKNSEGMCFVSTTATNRALDTFDCTRVPSPANTHKKRLCWCSNAQVAYSSCVGGANHLKDDLAVVCSTATCQVSDCCESNPTCSGFAGCTSGTNYLIASPEGTTCASDTCQVSECCETCTSNQANCAVSTDNTCSVAIGLTTKTPCTSVIAAGYYLDGDVVKTCATVSDSSARTCNDGGASGIQTVTCNTGFYQSGTAGSNLGCSACTNQVHCAVSTAGTCSTTAFPATVCTYEELSAGTAGCSAGKEIKTFVECEDAVAKLGRTSSQTFNECFTSSSPAIKNTGIWCAWKTTQNHLIFNSCPLTTGGVGQYS